MILKGKAIVVITGLALCFMVTLSYAQSTTTEQETKQADHGESNNSTNASLPATDEGSADNGNQSNAPLDSD